MTALPPSPLRLSLKFWTLLMSLRHLQHRKQFLSILAGRQSCIPPDQCMLQGNTPPTPVLRPRRRPQVPSHTTPVAHPSCPSKALPSVRPTSSPPPQALALTKPSTPPRGFTGVTSCLRVPKFEETGQEAFENMTSIGLVATPGISSVCATRVVKDDETGLVYMDTMTTSVGGVVLGTDSVSSNDGPVIEDITEQLEDIPPNNQPIGK